MSASASDEPVITAETARPVGGQSAPERGDRARLSGYRRRFAIFYTGLAVIAGAGLGAFVVLLVKPDAAPAPAWSLWKPDAKSTDSRVKEIADHVSTRYRLSSGQQLTVALAGPPTVTAGSSEGGTGSIPVRAIAVRPDTSTGKAEEDDIEIVGASGSIQYVLCGLGNNCSVSVGKASEARHALLRREAIELALYTFKYNDDIDSVSVFLPPRPDGQAAPSAVFLKRADLKGELKTPLTRSLTPTPPGIGQMPQHELALVNRVTRPRLYGYEYQQAQDGSAVLVFSPALATS